MVASLQPVSPEAEPETPPETPETPEAVEWPDDAAESAFLAEARERGEPVKATPAAVEMAEEAVDPKAMPKLDDLVNRIPADVREALEDLFRARFVRVQRVPKRVLKR